MVVPTNKHAIVSGPVPQRTWLKFTLGGLLEEFTSTQDFDPAVIHAFVKAHPVFADEQVTADFVGPVVARLLAPGAPNGLPVFLEALPPLVSALLILTAVALGPSSTNLSVMVCSRDYLVACVRPVARCLSVTLCVGAFPDPVPEGPILVVFESNAGPTALEGPLAHRTAGLLVFVDPATHRDQEWFGSNPAWPGNMGTFARTSVFVLPEPLLLDLDDEKVLPWSRLFSAESHQLIRRLGKARTHAATVEEVKADPALCAQARALAKGVAVPKGYAQGGAPWIAPLSTVTILMVPGTTLSMDPFLLLDPFPGFCARRAKLSRATGSPPLSVAFRDGLGVTLEPPRALKRPFSQLESGRTRDQQCAQCGTKLGLPGKMCTCCQRLFCEACKCQAVSSSPRSSVRVFGRVALPPVQGISGTTSLPRALWFGLLPSLKGRLPLDRAFKHLCGALVAWARFKGPCVVAVEVPEMVHALCLLQPLEGVHMAIADPGSGAPPEPSRTQPLSVLFFSASASQATHPAGRVDVLFRIRNKHTLQGLMEFFTERPLLVVFWDVQPQVSLGTKAHVKKEIL